jgi:membrane-anchored mycosin MYCP
MRTGGRVVLVVVAAGAALAGPGPVAAAARCHSVEQGGGLVRETPWPQLMLAPERAWAFGTGAGVTVAVVDAGTDRHPQLAGGLLPGYDVVDGTANADSACVSRGTAIATMIGARAAAGVGFRGFAPGAAILPVRIGDSELSDNQLDRRSVSPDRLAEGIRRAVDGGARIVTVAVALYETSPALRAAVARAHRRGALVVAPVGDQHQQQPPDPTPYPAAYPDVIGVGAVDATGGRASGSQVGGYVDVAAPGVDVLGGTLAGGYRTWSGTGFATAYVSGTAALLWSAAPALPVDEVARRLLATASPVRGGRGQEYGSGMVDPYRAVTETVSDRAPQRAAPLPPPRVDPAAVAAARRQAASRGRAGWLALGGLAVGVLAVAAAASLPRGRRRRWRAGRAPAVPAGSVDDDITGGYRVPLTTREVFAPPEHR